MPVSTNFELIYEFNKQGTGPGFYGDWPARIVIKKNYVSGSEETRTFIPECLELEPNDLMLVDWQGKLIHVGHVA